MCKRLFWLLCLLSPLLATAQESFDYKAAEARIKKHIFSSPDSTRIIIDGILERKNLHDTIRGLVHNIYGIYYSHIGQMDSSTVQYKKSLGYLKNYPRIKTMPLGNLSINYRNKGQYPESFRCLDEALEINKAMGLKDKEAVIYSHMSSNYQFMLEYDKAVEYALKGIAILKQINSPHLAASTQKLANIYLKMENFNFAKDLYEDCLKEFRRQNDMVSYTPTLINYAESLIHLNRFDKAKKALHEAIAELKSLKNPEYLAIAYSKLGRIAKDEHELDEAAKNYEPAFKILSATNSINAVVIASEYIGVLNKSGKYKDALRIINTARSLTIFRHVNQEDMMHFDVASAETFSNTNNDKEAIEKLEETIRIKDSIAKADKGFYAEEMQAKFQTKLQREKNSALKAKNVVLQKASETERTQMLLYITASLALIIVILLFLRSYWLKGRLHKEELKLAGNERSMLLKHHEHEKEITQAQKDIIEEKQRELASSALKMASYQDSLLQVIERCNTDSINKVSDVKKELESLIKQKDYWRQFETRFNTLHPDFGNSLLKRYANLTKNDIEFCSLLKLNLSNKEIAQMLSISQESAITKKYRIKKKMNVNDDTDFEKILLGM